MTYRLLLAILVSAASTLAAASGPANAVERGVLAFTPEQTTSTCIGDPKTPLCAIETWSACMMLARDEYCDLVGRWRRPDRLLPSAIQKLTRYPYEVYGPVVLTAHDIPDWARRQGRRSWRPGDLLIQLWWSGCSPENACVEATQTDPNRALGEGCPATQCSRQSRPQTYVTRMVGERWQVVDWLTSDPVPGDQRLFPNLK